jgi:hypothetical protein
LRVDSFIAATASGNRELLSVPACSWARESAARGWDQENSIRTGNYAGLFKDGRPFEQFVAVARVVDHRHEGGAGERVSLQAIHDRRVNFIQAFGAGRDLDDPERARRHGVNRLGVDFVLMDYAIGEHLLQQRRNQVLAEQIDRFVRRILF